MRTEEEQKNVDRLCTIIANFVGVNEMPDEALVALQPIAELIDCSSNLLNFWNDRFQKAYGL